MFRVPTNSILSDFQQHQKKKQKKKEEEEKREKERKEGENFASHEGQIVALLVESSRKRKRG